MAELFGQAMQVAADFWDVLGEMSPYLLFGFAVAGILSVFISPKMVERHLGGEGFLASLKAAAFGVPLPLCSCGVIPVSASLRRSGAGKGPTLAFLISTPQTGVDSILVTWSLLGPLFAIYRPIVALFSGLLGGGLTSFVSRLADGKTGSDACCGSGDGHADNHVHSDACSANQPVDSSCCSGEHGHSHEHSHDDAPKRGRIRQALVYGFGDLPEDIGKALLVGLVASAMITALVPKGILAEPLGHSVLTMLVMMAVGIPLYVCATASVPIAAALLAQGIVTPGAALVFLMTGPATNAATIATIWRVMGKREAMLYLLTVAGCALGAGLLLDAIWTGSALGGMLHQDMWMMPDWLKSISAVILLGVLVVGVVRPMLKRRQARGIDEGTPLELIVRGMTCNHCVQAVRRALLEIDGVSQVDVILRTGTVTIRGEHLDSPRAEEEIVRKIVAAIEELGYSVTGHSSSA